MWRAFLGPFPPSLPRQVIGTCPKGKEGVDGATACDELIVTDTIAGALLCESHPLARADDTSATRPRHVR